MTIPTTKGVKLDSSYYKRLNFTIPTKKRKPKKLKVQLLEKNPKKFKSSAVGEVGVRHEEGVACEEGVADEVAHAGRRVAS